MIPGDPEAKPQYHDWLDELLAERDSLRDERDALAARLAEAERQRDEALASVVLYVNERDAARDGWEAQVRSEEREMRRRIEAEARADNLAPYVMRSQAAEARVAALTEALRYAQFFITVSLPLIDRHGSGEGIEIGGEVLAKIEALIGPYETGMLSRAAADRPEVWVCGRAGGGRTLGER